MQKLSNKIISIAISLLMIISIGGASTMLLQNAHAQINLPTEAYINIAPNPCGVGQTVTVDFWLGVPIINSAYATGMTVYVTLPDGTSTTLGPFLSDETGGSHTTYTPTETGTYSFYMKYAGQTLIGGAYAGDVEEPSTSATVTLTVTSTPASQYPFTPLPTSYWQSPVNAENVQNWWAITGPWLGLGPQPFGATGMYNGTCATDCSSGAYNPYTTAPTTGHILWTTPWTEGGVAGGNPGEGGGPSAGTEEGDYWITSQYEPKWAPVVINGIMYSTWYTDTTSDSNGIRALDLYTGQQLWVLNTTNPLVCGMVTYFETINEYGYVGPYIWTTGPLPAYMSGGIQINLAAGKTEWNMYDALTSEYICSIVNGTGDSVGSGCLYADANGNLIDLYDNATAGTQIIYTNEIASSATPVTTTGPSLCMFNFTQCLQTSMQNTVTSGPTDWLWEPPLDRVYSWNLGIMNEVNIDPTMASIVAGTNGYVASYGQGGIGSDTLVLTANGQTGEFSGSETRGWTYADGYNIYTLALMWTNNITETPYTRTSQGYGSGVMTDVNCETDVVTGWSLATGDKLWTTTLTGDNGAAANGYDTFDIYSVYTNGIAYFYGFGGDMWAINLNTGATIWYTNTTTLFGSPGLETPYGIWPLWIFGNVVTNGQIIIYAGGHEYDPPLFHGDQEFALNCTNGQLIWSVLGYDTTGVELSYGILMGLNSYDGQLYAYGQGPSQTTVSAPSIGVTTATPVDISGTVMDVSAGTTQQAVKADFPNGVPCVSDASQSDWMAYVYEQQPHPSSVTGVTVDLTSIDPNGNTVPIGTATSDASGYFHYSWTPPITGSYTIIATFAGSGAYYGSYAETSVIAGSPAATPQPTASPVSLASTQNYILGIGIAMIVILIVIGAVVVMLLLRKKP